MKHLRDELQPERMAYAIKQIEAKGYQVTRMGPAKIVFEYEGYQINFFPYTGWASGKTITDGRGIKNLIRQI